MTVWSGWGGQQGEVRRREKICIGFPEIVERLELHNKAIKLVLSFFDCNFVAYIQDGS